MVGDADDSNGNKSNLSCPNCGEAVSSDVEYCSSCGIRLVRNQYDQKRKLIPPALNRTEILLSVGSAIVILGAFLNWMENPFTATTGLTTGLGYITILFSSVILILAYVETRTQTRMAISVVVSLLLLFISLWVFGIIVAEENVRTGGGLILTFIGACIILVPGFRKYSKVSSRKRATGLVLSVFIVVIVLPVLLFQGITLWEEYQVQQEQQETRAQAEQDLRDIEIEEVIAYTSNYEENTEIPSGDTYLEGTLTVEIILHNPTEREITVILEEEHEGTQNWRNEQEISVPAKETKTVETGTSELSRWDKVRVHDLPLDGRSCQSEFTHSSIESGYTCNATPGEYILILTWDHHESPS